MHCRARPHGLAAGYGWRALVEADISRWKRVIGDGVRSQTDGRQASEVAIAAEVLNRMLDLGRPEYIRTAWPGTRLGLRAPTAPFHSTRRGPCRLSTKAICCRSF